MNKWIFLVVLLCACNGYALTEQERNRISDISKRISNFNWCKVNFTQEKKISALSRPLVSKGELIIVKSVGVQWNTNTPIESHVVLTQDGVFGEKGSGTIERLTPKDTPLVQAFMRALMDALSGNLLDLESVFTVVVREQGTSWELSLEPQDKTLSGFLKSMTLSGKDAIERVKLEETNSDLTYIAFSKPERFSSEPPNVVSNTFSQLPQ